MTDFWKKALKIAFFVVAIVALIYVIVGTFFMSSSKTNTNFGGFGKTMARTSSSTTSSDELEVALDKILINMQKGQYSYMKADMSLKVPDDKNKEALQEMMPRVRDIILRYSSNQNGDDLISNAGKDEYKEGLKDVLRDNLGIEVEDVYFRDFVLAR